MKPVKLPRLHCALLGLLPLRARKMEVVLQTSGSGGGGVKDTRDADVRFSANPAAKWKPRLRGPLWRWLGWGAACGSVSFACALAFGVGGTDAWIAMVAGIITWSLACAWIEAMRGSGGSWARAFGLALRLRAAGTALGAGIMLLGVPLPIAGGMNVLMIPDFSAGLFSMKLGHWVLSGFSTASVDFPRGFREVYLTTLIQGAWVLASVGVLAAIIFGVRGARRTTENE